MSEVKKVRLYVSSDEGFLCKSRDELDPRENYWVIEVPEAFGMVASQLVGFGSIAEMLIRTGIGRKVES